MTREKKNKKLSKVVDEEIKDSYTEEPQTVEEVEEKNLYDLINMMYENKE